MSKLSVIAVVLALSACQTAGPQDYKRVRTTLMPVDQAFYECEFEAEKAAPMSDLTRSPFALAAMQSDIMRKCMLAKGYAR